MKQQSLTTISPAQVSDFQTADPRGLYSPESITWRVNRETFLLLGGLRALTMQVAHPMVAQGVYDHSNFRNEPLKRLLRTLKTMLTIGYGTREAAMAAADQIRRVHHNIEGALPEAVGNFPAEAAYQANDPGLMIWVYATLVDSSLYMYDCLVTPLSSEQKATYYQESKLWVTLLGVPAAILPVDYQAFQRYVDTTLSGGDIAIGKSGETVLEHVYFPRLPFLPRWLYHPVQIFTCALLPTALREKTGYSWNGRRKTWVDRTVRFLKFIRPYLPGFIRLMPQARKAEKRWHSDNF